MPWRSIEDGCSFIFTSRILTIPRHYSVMLAGKLILDDAIIYETYSRRPLRRNGFPLLFSQRRECWVFCAVNFYTFFFAVTKILLLWKEQDKNENIFLKSSKLTVAALESEKVEGSSHSYELGHYFWKIKVIAILDSWNIHKLIPGKTNQLVWKIIHFDCSSEIMLSIFLCCHCHKRDDYNSLFVANIRMFSLEVLLVWVRV